MKRSQFIQEVFIPLYDTFLEELLSDYDEELGEKRPKVCDVYIEAFQSAATASEEAAMILETTTKCIDFWDKENDTK